jgi:hypothetical protein
VSSDGRIVPAWRLVALLPALWLGQLAASYGIASMHCRGVAFGATAGVHLLRVLVTAIAAACLLAVELALQRRRRAGDGDEQHAAAVGTVLGLLFATYLLWSLWPALATPVCT